jgi:Ca2+:H+ antiporter
VFASAALAIIPLAAWLGRATEHLASRVGEGMGGFLNATFGNAAEMIIALAALRKGHLEVVKSSIIGSILGNLLLVFGLAMLVGGARRPRQTFDRTAAGAGVSMMVVSVVALVIPAIFHLAIAGKSAHGGPPPPPGIEDRLAVDIALVLLLTYGLSLLFAFRTHRRHYTVTEGPAPVVAGHHHWPAKRSFLVLGGATALIVWMSELLVHSLDEAARALGMTEVFVGVFLVAIIGNAAEHSTAVLVAAKDRMDLAMAVAVGSSQQIALFVAPVLVLASYLFPQPLDFVYSPMEVIAVALSTFIFATVANDGESNWLEGALFLAVYAILGIGFFLLPG